MEVVRSIADPIVPGISFTEDTPGSLQEGQVLETDQAWESSFPWERSKEQRQETEEPEETWETEWTRYPKS